MKWRLIAALLVMWQFAPELAQASGPLVVAEAGTTGGSLGKTNKSISGEPPAAPSQPAPSASPYPFDGNWSGWLRTFGGRLASPTEATFTAVVNKGALRATISMYGESRTMTGQVGQDGALNGGRINGRNSYVLSGTIHRGQGTADFLGWKLEYTMTRR